MDQHRTALVSVPLRTDRGYGFLLFVVKQSRLFLRNIFDAKRQPVGLFRIHPEDTVFLKIPEHRFCGSQLLRCVRIVDLFFFALQHCAKQSCPRFASALLKLTKKLLCFFGACFQYNALFLAYLHLFSDREDRAQRLYHRRSVGFSDPCGYFKKICLGRFGAAVHREDAFYTLFLVIRLIGEACHVPFSRPVSFAEGHGHRHSHADLIFPPGGNAIGKTPVKFSRSDVDHHICIYHI